MQLRVRLVVLALFTFMVPSLAGAQDAADRQALAAPGPTVENTATAFRVLANVSDSTAMEMQRRQSAGKPVALMIVGGAAILVGAVIGDAPGTLFMVGGAVALLYGLYLYLQ